MSRKLKRQLARWSAKDLGEIEVKNTMPVNSYKGYVMSFIPLSPATGDTYLMIYANGTLEPGIYEFDFTTKTYKKVEAVERADKNYFISLTPKRNTIADVALEKL